MRSPMRLYMELKTKAINTLKTAYRGISVANIRPTGVILTRLLIFVMMLPILLVIDVFIMSFIAGYVSTNNRELIMTGITIIDHIFIPSVLMSLVGFLGLWIDKDNNGIPDKLEGDNSKNENIYKSGPRSDI